MTKVFDKFIECPNCHCYDELGNYFAFWVSEEGIELWDRQVDLLDELEELGYMIITCPKCDCSFIIKAKEI